MTINEFIKSRAFNVLITVGGAIAIGLTIYEAILAIKLHRLELKDVKNENAN